MTSEAQMPARTFTLAEAQDLVPWLAETFTALAPVRARAGQLNKEVESMVARMQSNGGSDIDKRLESLQAELTQVSGDIEQRVQAIQQRGIVVRRVDRGLVDFLSAREGRQVCLCWQEGEERIAFWHEEDAGFAGRQPL